MRISFDSNAWEALFTPDAAKFAPVIEALQSRRIEGFICATSFRIEAVPRRDRPSYFAQPYMAVAMDPLIFAANGVIDLAVSIGPDNGMHPGLPPVQADKLRRALSIGFKLLYGEHWMGLPIPIEVRDKALYVMENADEARAREDRQYLACSAIEARGVGKAMFDAVDGWTDKPRTSVEEKELSRACAEWADGELVATHIAYHNDILCTNDQARSAGRSIFDATNRAWLSATYSVTCLTLDDLVAKLSV